MSPLYNVPLRWRVLIGENKSLFLAFEASLSAATTAVAQRRELYQQEDRYIRSSNRKTRRRRHSPVTLKIPTGYLPGTVLQQWQHTRYRVRRIYSYLHELVLLRVEIDPWTVEPTHYTSHPVLRPADVLSALSRRMNTDYQLRRTGNYEITLSLMLLPCSSDLLGRVSYFTRSWPFNGAKK